ncbi:MAG: hypothetical protein NC093_07530 [Alistipes sp.]|nr:hypothetical protein [Alistipes sp.]
MNYDELTVLLNMNISFLNFGLFFVIKYFLDNVFLLGISPKNHSSELRNYAARLSAVCSGFLLLSVLFIILFWNNMLNPFIPVYFASAIFLAAGLIISYHKRKPLVRQNFYINKPLAVILAAAVLMISVIRRFREDVYVLQYKSLSFKSSENLLYPYISPDITGRCNQMIKLENSDGSVRQALFLIDSNDYTGEGINEYDYIHDDQVDWYAEQVKMLQSDHPDVKSMIFFHIPLQQYRTAYELYVEGSGDVTYFFGANNEKMIDKVCCSDYPSKLFDTAVSLGSTKAMFCGHDHYNNLSVEYQGIRLTYGMSIDYLAMPGIDKDTAQRGGELITIGKNGEFDITQIPLADIE